MSIEAMTIVWKAQITDRRGQPDHTKKLVLLRLADNSNHAAVCWPSVADLAAHSQLSERQVQRELKDLTTRDTLVEVLQRGKRGGRFLAPRSPRYRLRLDRIARLPQVRPSTDDMVSEVQNTDDSVSPTSDRAMSSTSDRAMSPESSLESPVNRQLTTSAPNGQGRPAQVQFSDGTFHVSEPLIENWKDTYPAIDVLQQILAAAAWMRANPKNVKRNWQRFLVGWLGRAQERAPRVKPNAEEGRVVPKWTPPGRDEPQTPEVAAPYREGIRGQLGLRTVGD